MPAIIETHGLTRRFGGLTAVDHLDLSIEAGEIFGLVGPDGAGKTTTLRMLTSLLDPTEGSARVAGRDVVREPQAVKDQICYMAQRFGLYLDLTVQENMDFYADLFGIVGAERKALAAELLHMTRMDPFRNRQAGQLSGGMKQKLALSCALVHQPELLLLDEPTFGVDPVSRRDLWLIVHDMVAEGVTAIVSTAYMDEAERFDRVALLERGRILALETPAALQAGLEGRILSVQVDRPREARQVLATHPEVGRAAVFGDRIHVATPSTAGAGPAIRRALEAAGFAVASVEPVEASMEDVFIDRIAGAGSRPRSEAAREVRP